MLHIISDTNIGGAGRHLLTFLEHYDRSRLEAQVFCPPGSLLIEPSQRAGVKTHTSPHFSGDRSFDWRGLAGLMGDVGSILRTHRFDIVHTHATFSGRLAAKAAGAPAIVFTKHRMDWEASRGGLKGRAITFLNRITCDRVIAVSQAVKESLLQEGLPEEKIKLIHNGIDIRKFREQALISGSEKGAGPGADPNPVIGCAGPVPVIAPVNVGIVARLEPEKGHRYFLEAAAAILNRRKDVVFWVVGGGSLAGTLLEMARGLGIDGKVVFTGHRDDIPQLLNRVDVVAIPSLTEAFGLSLIEAMCLSKPCVASAVGGLKEIAGEDGRFALLAPPADSSALAERIEYLLEHPEEARAMGRRAAEEVEKNYDAQRMAEKMTALYEELAGRAGRRK